jgi:hypothetical protein
MKTSFILIFIYHLKLFFIMKYTYRKDGQVCDFDLYLHRPSALKDLKYNEFDSQFVRSYGNLDLYPEPDFYNIDMKMPLKKGIYIKRRSTAIENRSITRIETLPFSCGEPFYLRMIIMSRPVHSYVDARTHDGHTYKTYQECAIAAGIVKDGYVIT